MQLALFMTSYRTYFSTQKLGKQPGGPQVCSTLWVLPLPACFLNSKQWGAHLPRAGRSMACSSMDEPMSARSLPVRMRGCALQSISELQFTPLSGLCPTCRVSSLLKQPSDEPVVVRLVAFAAALLPVILASGLAYRLASGADLSSALYKVCGVVCPLDYCSSVL